MAAENDVYVLHYFQFSLYSLMVRFGLVLGRRLNPETAPKVEIRLVNLHREENYSELYLKIAMKSPNGCVRNNRNLFPRIIEKSFRR